ncbi:phage tail protein [Chitinophaga sp. S165]|uniref:phage tail protein n=1 Tax=Chitinophaga sp. S165 TaxID=2135462 RepID=UPI000D716330|nr:phage tail protein [Chitinophaga sp. S165]PWV55902.1 phage tail-like protein [Chitinophaga sp. S165]
MDPGYPMTGFHYKVNFISYPGKEEGNFQEVSGISVNIATETVKEGGENQFVYKLPSPPQYSNLVLKRGLLVGSSVTDWVRTTLSSFKFKPTTIVVMLLDELHKPIYSWKFYGVYPVKMEVSGIKAKGDGEIVIETLELAYKYFEKYN